jgi:DNA-binding response OmpR family regulator
MLRVASLFGADGTIQKPFELDTLLATIAALLDKP